MPRPTKITPAARAAIASGLARGATHAEVCAAARISKGTLDNWLKRANTADHARRSKERIAAADRPFLQLFDDLRDAEADVEFDALQQIVNHLSIGVDLPTAAAAANVPAALLTRLEDRATQYRNQQDDGERLDAEGTEYLKLFEGYNGALARSKVTALATMNKVILNGDWHAAAWWLERGWPDEFASPNKRRSGGENRGGRPIGASSAPDRPSTADEPPPRIRLRQVKG